MMFTHIEEANKALAWNSIHDTKKDDMQHNTSNNIGQGRIAMNNGHIDNINVMPLHSNIEEPNENTTT